MLAIIKLGAVIMPTTTAVGPADLRRPHRAAAPRGSSSATPTTRQSSTDVPGDYARSSAGGAAPTAGRRRRRGSGRRTAGRAPGHGPGRPAAAVLHQRDDQPAEAGRAHPGDLPRRPPDHDVLARPAARRRAPEHLVAGLGQARVVLLLRARGSPRRRSPLQLHALRRGRAARGSCATRASPRSAPRQRCGGCSSTPTSPAGRRLREVIGAGEPLNPEVIEQVRRPGALTIRDGFGQTETTAQVGNTPGSVVKPGSMGRPLPGVPVVLVDPVTGEPRDGPGRARSASTCPTRPLPLMTGYQGDDERNAEAMAGGYYHTGDVASATRTATSPTSAAPTTSSRPATTRSARSSSSRC